MSEKKKGFFARAAEKLRKPQPKPEHDPVIIERGPLQHADDDRLHASAHTVRAERRSA